MARAETVPPAAPKPEERIPAPPKWIPALAIFLVFVLIVGLFYAGRYGWQRFVAYRTSRRPSSSSAAPDQQKGAANTAPTTADSAAASPGNNAAASLDLSVSTSASTRIRILADGRPVLDSDLPAGETRHFSANQQFEVTAGDSSAVLLELNGQAMPPVGAPGASGTIVLSQ